MQNHSAKTLLSHKLSLEGLFDTLPALIYCKDLGGRIICVNEAFAACFQMKKVDFEDRWPKDIMPSAAYLMQDDTDVIKTGEPQQTTLLSIETPDGERWAQVYRCPFRNMGGEVVGVIGFAVDITRVKEMQEELRKSEEKYRNYFNTARDCIYITGTDGIVFEVNDAALETFGFETKEELMGLSVQDFYKNPEDRERLRQKIARDGLVDKFPLDMRRKDGRVIHTLITALPLKNGDGRIYGYQGTVHDVTMLKKAESQQQLLEAELRQAQKMEAVAKLSGGIAHDFNNLLFTIMGSIELAQSFKADGQKRQLDRAYRACLEAKQLMRRFLELSGNQMAAKSKGSIAELIQCAVSPRIVSSDRIYYEIQLSGGLYRAAFIYDQLLQVMENLLSNAENAIVDSGTIIVAAENVELTKGMLYPGKSLAPGKYVKISISDNGVGIPENKIDKIFDPYFSTREQPASKGHGLGLGLTTVYATIKRHKGDIVIDSEPEKGTTVSIYLPAAS